MLDKRDKIDALDFVINCLVEHEKKLDQFVEVIEGKGIWLNPDEISNESIVQLFDKRGPTWKNLGSIVEKKQKMNSVELSTDRGYILCISYDYNGIIPTDNKK